MVTISVHGAAQGRIVGERVAQAVWQDQHPQAHGEIVEEAVDEVGGQRRRVLAARQRG